MEWIGPAARRLTQLYGTLMPCVAALWPVSELGPAILCWAFLLLGAAATASV